MKRIPAHFRILLAIVLAVGCGLAVGPDSRIGAVRIVDVFDFVGTLFLNALRMVVVPLVVTSVVSGVASIGSMSGFGRLGLKTMGYYFTTTLIAVLIGLSLVNLIQPGEGLPQRSIEALSEESQASLEKVEGRGWRDLAGVVQRIIPANVFQSAAHDDMLGLIFFSILAGAALGRLSSGRQERLLELVRGANDVMLMITGWILLITPIGVFALVAEVTATTGLDAFQNLVAFFITVLLGLFLHAVVVLPLLVALLGRVSPIRHFRAMTPALLTAFSTASSSATLPLTMECLEKRAGVSNKTTSFVVPLGATINMDGTALYECVAVLFIAQWYGVELGLAGQFTVVILALMTSVGVAGIPAASLVAIVLIMNAVGVPAEGLGLILAVDRILDMCRTAVNVFSDACGAVIIGRSEGEKGILSANP